MFTKRAALVCSAALLVVCAACSTAVDISTMTDEEFMAYAQKVHDRAITLDTHVDIPGGRYATPEMDPGSEDFRNKCSLPKMEQGGLDGTFLAVYVGQRGGLDEEGYRNVYNQAMEKFTAIHRLTEEMHPDRCELAVSPDDVERIVKTGKRIIMIGIENGYPIGDDIARLQEFYDLGTRYITLCHSSNNQICDSSTDREPLYDGLSEFGRQVVAEMNRLGIMIDMSHAADETFWDVIEASQAPIILSHSNCDGVYEQARNIDDDMLRALAENGGVIQAVTMYVGTDSQERRDAIQALRDELGIVGRGGRGGRPFGRQRPAAPEMTEEQRAEYQRNMQIYSERMAEIDQQYPPVNVSNYVDHIDHAVQVAGIDHVGIGTDFDGGGGVSGFNDHSECLNVTIELLRRGYTEKEIQKIWGGNLLRVWREVERVARELQR